MIATLRPVNLATSSIPVRRRLRHRLGALLAAAIALWMVSGPRCVYADDELGSWTATYDKNGTAKTPKHFGQGKVFKDAKGHYYIKFTSGGRVMSLEPGSVTSWDGNNPGNATQTNTTPAQQSFDNDLQNFIHLEIAGLTPAAPAVGTSFFPLELTPSLQSQGDAAQLWGDQSPFFSTNGVIGLEQGSSLLSILGSSTADGLSPVLYQYEPNVAGLSFSFASSLQVTLDTGSTYVPTVQSTDYVVTATTPEPGTLLWALVGFAWTGGWLAWEARRRVKRGHS
jgi:hypothetical protein